MATTSSAQPRADAAPAALLRIGDVAEAAGVSVDALRFYERRGLLKPAARRASGYREYTDDTIRLVRFIRQAQSLGFTLAEVDELVRLRERAWSGGAPMRLREATVAKMHEIDRRVRELRALRGALASLLKDCDKACASGKPTVNALDCPLIEALDAAAGLDEGEGAGKARTSRAPAPGRTVARKRRAPVPTPSPSNRRRP
jgi:MerR family copper efflux transcriptional regulator